MEIIDQLLVFMQEHLIGQVGVLAIVLEFALRLMKTRKPLSILWLLKSGAEKMAELFRLLAEFLDKVLPQRTDEE